jgi:hypothetical protein
LVTPASRDCDGDTSKPRTILIRFRKPREEQPAAAAAPLHDDTSMAATAGGVGNGNDTGNDDNDTLPKSRPSGPHGNILDEYRVPIDELLASGDDALWDHHPLAPAKRNTTTTPATTGSGGTTITTGSKKNGIITTTTTPVAASALASNGDEGSGDEVDEAEEAPVIVPKRKTKQRVK